MQPFSVSNCRDWKLTRDFMFSLFEKSKTSSSYRQMFLVCYFPSYFSEIYLLVDAHCKLKLGIVKTLIWWAFVVISIVFSSFVRYLQSLCCWLHQASIMPSLQTFFDLSDEKKTNKVNFVTREMGQIGFIFTWRPSVPQSHFGEDISRLDGNINVLPKLF